MNRQELNQALFEKHLKKGIGFCVMTVEEIKILIQKYDLMLKPYILFINSQDAKH